MFSKERTIPVLTVEGTHIVLIEATDRDEFVEWVKPDGNMNIFFKAPDSMITFQRSYKGPIQKAMIGDPSEIFNRRIELERLEADPLDLDAQEQEAGEKPIKLKDSGKRTSKEFVADLVSGRLWNEITGVDIGPDFYLLMMVMIAFFEAIMLRPDIFLASMIAFMLSYFVMIGLLIFLMFRMMAKGAPS